MFSVITTLAGKYKLHLAFAALVLGALYSLYAWAQWSIAANATITQLRQDVATLKEEIEMHIQDTADDAVVFDEIADSQRELYCAAKYGVPLPPIDPTAPTLVDIQEHKAKSAPISVKAPDKPVTETEPHTIVTYEIRPVSDDVSLGVLNNTWKAYCAAITEDEPICEPFKKKL